MLAINLEPKLEKLYFNVKSFTRYTHGSFTSWFLICFSSKWILNPFERVYRHSLRLCFLYQHDIIVGVRKPDLTKRGHHVHIKRDHLVFNIRCPESSERFCGILFLDIK
jgi:hypothetical protein